MAKDRTTSAREFLLTESRRASGPPRLSDWLVKDVKPHRSSETAEAAGALESHAATVEPGRLDPEPESAVVTPAAPELDDDAVAEGDASPELDESRDLAESLSYAHEADPSDEASAPPEGDHRVAPKIYESAEDWLDDRDAAARFSAPEQPSEDSDDAPGALLGAGAGPSLSPQVLEPHEEEDPSAKYVVPGTGDTWPWKIAAGVAAVLLLAFLVVHRTKHVSHAPVTASRVSAVPDVTSRPHTDALADSRSEPPEPSASKIDSRFGAFGGGRSRGASEPEAAGNSGFPGGPSVARFPDLPRDVLVQLEQAFQADELHRAKGATDSVERY